MITKVRIKNFKCYGPRGTDFNLSKVNFIFGDNSSGKSSLLQFLKWVYDAVRNPAENGDENQRSIQDHVYQGDEPDIPGLPVEVLQGIDLSQCDRVKKMFPCAGRPQRFVSAAIHVRDEDCDALVERDLLFMPGDGSYPLYEVRPHVEGHVFPIEADDYDCYGGSVIHVEASRAAPGGVEPEIVSWDDLAQLKPLSIGRRVGKELEDTYVGKKAARTFRYLDDFLTRIGVEYGPVRWFDDVMLDESRIHDKVLGKDFNLRDVGTGIQRLFGMARLFEAWQDGILQVEEPESNVNERQVAALTRVMVEEALDRPRGQLIVECHSKLVALELAALVRQGVLRMDGPDANLSICEVVKRRRGSEVKQIKISRSGEIRWPGGFFPSEGDILRRMYGVDA